MAISHLELRDLSVEFSVRSDECARRCSINRAYYSAYHAMTAIAHVVPGEEKRSGDEDIGHYEVVRRLKNFDLCKRSYPRLAPLVSRAKKLAGTYRAAMEAREEADYVLETDIDSSAVEIQLFRLSRIIEFADDVQAELRRLGAAK